MPVSPTLRCIFVHIPRTGGTSIETALGMGGDWLVENTETMFGRISSPEFQDYTATTVTLQHLSAEQLSRLVPGFKKYFRFSVVRNPWDRMVSTYCYQMRAEGYSFDEFLEATEGSASAWHVPQSRLLLDGPGRELVDFVARFENLAQDFRHVCERLGIERVLPHRNGLVHGHYRGYYDEDSRAIVARRYREDIERFGYAF
jgi:hypothetical protein